MDRFLAACLPRDNKPGPGVTLLKRLQKNQFYVKHRGQIPGQGEFLSSISQTKLSDHHLESKIWTIKRISTKNAKTHEFEVKDKDTGAPYTTTVFEYYLKKYRVRLDKWQLPLLETQKRDVLFPMELAIMAPRQRYPYKLNEDQV